MTATMTTLKRVKEESLTGMRKVLYDLAIDPFDMQTVEEYKENALKPYKWRDVLADCYPSVENVLKGSTVISAFVLLLAALLMPVIAAHSKIAAETLFTYQWWLAITPVALFVSAAIFDNAMARLKVASWKLEWLTNYKQPIPEFVQQTIDDIRASGQRCDIFIDYMTTERVQLPDPFLVLRCVDENYQHIDYYVEVWNESYQKKRVV